MKKLALFVLILVITTSGISAHQHLAKENNLRQQRIQQDEFDKRNRIERINGKAARANKVLVMFKSNASNAKRSSALQNLKDVDINCLKATGICIATHPSLSTQELINYFSNQEIVDSVEPDYLLQLYRIPNDPNFQSQWAFWNSGQTIQGQAGNIGVDVKASPAWNITTGNNSNVVAVIDSGLSYNHQDLRDNVWTAPTNYTVDLGNGHILQCPAGSHGIDTLDFDCDPTDEVNPPSPNEDYAESHGTHVSGIIGARGNNSQGITGLNWNAGILPIRVTNGVDSFDTSNAIRAIDYIVQLKSIFGSQANIRIANASWGHIDSQAPPPLVAAINKLNQANILFVAAAGNGGHDQIGDDNDNINITVYPASLNLPNVISVANIRNTGDLTLSSNFGHKSVHLAAPGNLINSTVRGNSYAYMGGTSQAAPQVSGAASLILSICTLNTEELKNVILNNTDPTPNLAGKTKTGGRLNVYRALKSCAAEPATINYKMTIIGEPFNPGLGTINQLNDINNNGQVLGVKASVTPHIT